MDDVKLYDKAERQLESSVNAVQVFSCDIRMDFGIEKCAKLVIKRGKVTTSEEIVHLDGREIK